MHPAQYIVHTRSRCNICPITADVQYNHKEKSSQGKRSARNLKSYKVTETHWGGDSVNLLHHFSAINVLRLIRKRSATILVLMATRSPGNFSLLRFYVVARHLCQIQRKILTVYIFARVEPNEETDCAKVVHAF